MAWNNKHTAPSILWRLKNFLICLTLLMLVRDSLQVAQSEEEVHISLFDGTFPAQERGSHAPRTTRGDWNVVLIMKDKCPNSLPFSEEMHENCVRIRNERNISKEDRQILIKEHGCSSFPVFNKSCSKLQYKVLLSLNFLFKEYPAA